MSLHYDLIMKLDIWSNVLEPYAEGINSFLLILLQAYLKTLIENLNHSYEETIINNLSKLSNI